MPNTLYAHSEFREPTRAQMPLAPVFVAPPLPVDPECESSGCDCDDEFDTFVPDEAASADR